MRDHFQFNQIVIVFFRLSIVGEGEKSHEIEKWEREKSNSIIIICFIIVNIIFMVKIVESV